MADEDTRRLIPMSVKKLEDNLYSIEIEGGHQSPFLLLYSYLLHLRVQIY